MYNNKFNISIINMANISNPIFDYLADRRYVNIKLVHVIHGYEYFKEAIART